jgi:hypothetical protein
MITHAAAKRLIPIVAWLMALGLVALVFFVPIAGVIIFLIAVAVIFAMNWKTNCTVATLDRLVTVITIARGSSCMPGTSGLT